MSVYEVLRYRGGGSALQFTLQLPVSYAMADVVDPWH